MERLRKFDLLKLVGSLIDNHPRLTAAVLMGLASLPIIGLGKEITLVWGLAVGILALSLLPLVDRIGKNQTL